MANHERRLSIVWLFLSLITVVSWWIGSRHSQAGFRLDGLVTFGVVLIAALKVRIIIAEFMGAREGPIWLGRIMDVWLALLVISLLGIYVVGAGFRV